MRFPRTAIPFLCTARRCRSLPLLFPAKRSGRVRRICRLPVVSMLWMPGRHMCQSRPCMGLSGRYRRCILFRLLSGKPRSRAEQPRPRLLPGRTTVPWEWMCTACRPATWRFLFCRLRKCSFRGALSPRLRHRRQRPRSRRRGSLFQVLMQCATALWSIPRYKASPGWYSA